MQQIQNHTKENAEVSFLKVEHLTMTDRTSDRHAQ